MRLVLTILSATSLVAAQSYGSYSSSTSSSATSASSSATPSTTPSAALSSKIPTDISSSCSTFLTALNSEPSIQNCIDPVLNALAANDTASLSSICAAATSGSCSASTMRTWLAYFRGNCTNEVVTSPNSNVLATYDMMYSLNPFLSAVCTKDLTGQYCISQSAGNSSVNAASGMANVTQTPLATSDGTPDAQAFTTAGILFLGANASMDATTLCTVCTKNVLTNYISFESTMPPAAALSQLPLLSSQASLWNAVQKTCPANFISGALSNAGASPNVVNGASTSSPANAAMAVLAIVATRVITL